MPTELPVWYAKEEGIFTKHGLNVDLRLADSSAGLPALLSGEVQIADLAVQQVISGAAGGANVVDIAENSPYYPYVLQVAPNIKTVNDLKGKKVGVSSIGSASDIATRLVLEKIGLTPDKDVTIVPVGSASNRVAAMQSGAIQAGLSIPPDTLTLQAKGFNQLYDLAQLKIPTGNATEVTTRDYLTAHRDVVQKYVDADVDSIAQIKKNKAKAIAVLKKYYKSNDDNAMSVAYDYLVKSILPDYPYPKADQFTSSIPLMAQKNPKVKNVDPTKYLDASLVQSAADRKVGQ